ncbi:MAG TPA: cell division protein FtsH, partial [Bacillota bacterium]|nr:cell division protein FtsH [Bacillota bacterium]
IDKEVRRIIHECYSRAKTLLQENEELLRKIAHYLLEVETLTKEDIQEIVQTGKLARWDNILATDPRVDKEPAPDAPATPAQVETVSSVPDSDKNG